MVSNSRCLLVVIALAVALAACSSSTGQADEATEDLSVDQILTDAATAMSEAESAIFTIEQTGASVFIDDEGQLGFLSAEGRFAAPASAEALITVNALGFTTTVGGIAIDGSTWFTNPLTGDWTEAPESFTFDPSTVFDADVGFPALLTEAATTAQMIDDTSDETTDGEDAGGDGDGNLSGGTAVEGDNHHLRMTVAAERVRVLTGGLVTEETEADLWIDTGTNRVAEARFDLPIGDELSSWRMTISDYDTEVNIVAPELGADG